MIKPREYQKEAIEKCVEHFRRKCKEPSIAVLPTGAGKSIVIALIAKEIKENLIVLQPSKEILEQNYKKFTSLGFKAGIYSASIGRKEVKQVVFATIGSVINNYHLFSEFKNVLIDECHLVNGEKGMYDFFLNGINGLCCIGLTATPYRLNKAGNVIEFLTRIRPSFFKKVIHVTQQKELKEKGFLCPIIYKRKKDIDTSRLLVKNGEYESVSVLNEFNRVKFENFIISEILEAEKTRKHILVFTENIEIMKKLIKLKELKFVTGSTPKEERAVLLEDFKNGKFNVLVNVGVLTTGFDFPALDCVIIAKPTRSLSLWYQIIGRAQRIFEGKSEALIVDMCDNYSLLGDVQKLEIITEDNKWIVKQDFKKITNKLLQ